MASYKDGSITYEVSIDTRDLLSNSGRVRAELLKLSENGETASKGINKLEQSASSAGSSLGKLSTIAKAVSAALVSSQILAYAQSWNELEDRIGNTGATASQTKDIMNQLLETSNRNGRSIEESSELYIRLSNSMKEFGYSTNDTLSYIDTLSNLMTINKTSAMGAQSAINALTKAQIAGKLSGENANSVFNAMPSILKTLGAQLNKTETEVKAMAANGELSMTQFSSAMIKAQSETATFADNMRNNVNDGITRVTNNLKQYLGELNNSTGATKILVDSLILMSEHVDVLVTGLGVLAAIYAGKYITSLASATKQSVEKMLADSRQALATKALEQAEINRIKTELSALNVQKQNIVMAQAYSNSLRAQTALTAQLTAVEAKITAAQNAHTAAQVRLSAAMKASSLVAGGLSSAINMLGGPAGAAMIAGGALYYFYQKAKQAREESVTLTDKVKSLNDELNNFSDKKLTVVKQDTINDIKNSEEQLKQLRFEMESTNEIATSDSWFITDERRNKAIAEVNNKLLEEEKILQGIADAKQTIVNIDNIIGARTGPVNQQQEEPVKQSFSKDTIDNISKATAKLAQETEIAELKQKGLTKEAYIYQAALTALGAEAENYKQSLLGLILGSADLSDMTSDQIATLDPLIKSLSKMYDLNESGSTKVKKASDSIDGLKTSLAGLQSPIEKENESYQSNIKVLNDSLKNKLIKQSDYNAKALQLEQEHQINLAKLRSEQTVSASDQAVAMVDSIQQLANENQQKLALIKEFEAQKLLTEQQSLALMDAASTEYEQKRTDAMWEMWRSQSETNELLASSLEGLASSATSTISGLMSGTMNATEAMQNFANVILNEAIGSLVSMGLQQVKNAITAQTTSATVTAAQVAEAATLTAAYTPAAMQASIASYGAAAIQGAAAYSSAIGQMSAMSIAGGREHGGTVGANSMYRVGEGNKPEILMAGGRQYMIPGESGKVISNSDIGSSNSGLSLNVVINNAPEGTTATMSNDNTLIIDEAAKKGAEMGYQKVSESISNHSGAVWTSLTQNTNTKAKL